MAICCFYHFMPNTSSVKSCEIDFFELKEEDNFTLNKDNENEYVFEIQIDLNKFYIKKVEKEVDKNSSNINNKDYKTAIDKMQELTAPINNFSLLTMALV